MTLLGLFIVLLGGVALVFVARFIWDLLTSASTQLASSVVAAAGLIVAAIIANVWSKQVERKRELEQEQRKQKAAIYEEFMTFWFRVLTRHSSKENGSESPVSQEEQDEYVIGFTYKLVSWGSESFLKEYVAFKERLGQEDALLHFEKVLFAIRTDLGHSKGLK